MTVGSADGARPRLAPRRLLAVAFLAAQLGGIAWARFTPTRYFAWAPYDQISLYSVEVTVDGRALAPDEVELRYGFPLWGRDNRSMHHVLDAVRQFEETYGAGDGAQVVIRYTVNGGEEERWAWPVP